MAHIGRYAGTAHGTAEAGFESPRISCESTPDSCVVAMKKPNHDSIPKTLEMTLQSALDVSQLARLFCVHCSVLEPNLAVFVESHAHRGSERQREIEREPASERARTSEQQKTGSFWHRA